MPRGQLTPAMKQVAQKILPEERAKLEKFLGKSSLTPEERSFLLKRAWAIQKKENIEKYDYKNLDAYCKANKARLQKQREEAQIRRDKKRARDKLKIKKEKEIIKKKTAKNL